MNQLLSTGKAPSMTSREIAALVGKRHDNVKRTVETLAQAGVIESPQSEEIPTATKPVAVYVFSGERGRRDSAAPRFASGENVARTDGGNHGR